MHLSIIIPIYRAENYLIELYNRLIVTLESITQHFEIIMIDDCSDDHSWEIIIQLARSDARVKGFKFSRNFGQHYGITAGLDYCKGDWAIVMDCDLQDQPEEIPKLYQKALEGYEIVLAKRKNRKDPVIKRFFSWLFYKIFSYFLDLQYDGEVGNFRILSKKVVSTFRLMRENLRFFGGMISWMGYQTTSIDVEHAKKDNNKSTYSLQKLCKLASDSIIAYSDKPLRLAIRLGFIMAMLSFLYGSTLFIKAFIYRSPVPGWTSLIVSLYFIGGIIIVILGIIGIYLGKTFDEAKKRPLYIIEEVVNG